MKLVSAPPSRARELREALGERVLVADGAMATMLYSHGSLLNRCFDEMNLSSPALVRDVHRQYVRAGADIVETNTFGANRQRLRAFGFDGKVREINRAGVRIAREAAGERAFVAGAVGPLGVRLAPLGRVQPEEAREIFREQIAALVEAGVDLLLLETFRDLQELREAVCAAREVGGSDLMVGALVSIEEDGTLENGSSPEVFTRTLDQMPVDMIGLNCSTGPRAMLDTIERMAPLAGKILCAMPNAGLPAAVDGRNIYLCSPEYLAQYARRFLEAGVRMVGGCCGTTPEHIVEIGKEARSFAVRTAEPGQGPRAVELPTVIESPAVLKIPAAEKSALGAKLGAGEFVTLAEILPPRGVDASQEVASAHLYQSAGFDGVAVTEGPRGSARLSAQVTAQLIQQETGMEAVLEFPCRHRTLASLQSELLGLHAAGLRNLICVTGDAYGRGAYPDATAQGDVDSIGLAGIAYNLNLGLLIGVNARLIDVNADRGAANLDREMRRLEAKVAAGAEFVVTQPVFDVNLLEEFVKRMEPFKIPVMARIRPLTCFRDAEFTLHELRIPVPAESVERMRAADGGDAARAEGVAIARETMVRVRSLASGVLVSTDSADQTALEIADAMGSRN